MDTGKSIRTYFRLKPRYKFILALLALCGLGLGYSLGFIFKSHTKTAGVKTATYSDMHTNVKTFIPFTTNTTPGKHSNNKRILKERTNTSNLGNQRVNRKTLDQDVIVNKTKQPPAEVKISSSIARS